MANNEGLSPLLKNIVAILSGAGALVSVIAFTPRVITVTRESEEFAWDAIDAIEQYQPDYHRAVLLVEKAARRRGNNAVVLVSEGVLDMSIEMLDIDGSAQKVLQRASRRRPRFAVPDFYLGRIDVYRGEYCSAIGHFENAMRKDPTDPEYVSWLGTAISLSHYYASVGSCPLADLEFAFSCLSKAANWPGRMEAMNLYRYADALLLAERSTEAHDVFWRGFHVDYISERAERYRARFLAHNNEEEESKGVLSGFTNEHSGWTAYDRAVLELCFLNGLEDDALGFLSRTEDSSALSQIRRLSSSLDVSRDPEDVCQEIRIRPLLWQDP